MKNTVKILSEFYIYSNMYFIQWTSSPQHHSTPANSWGGRGACFYIILLYTLSAHSLSPKKKEKERCLLTGSVCRCSQQDMSRYESPLLLCKFLRSHIWTPDNYQLRPDSFSQHIQVHSHTDSLPGGLYMRHGHKEMKSIRLSASHTAFLPNQVGSCS